MDPSNITDTRLRKRKAPAPTADQHATPTPEVDAEQTNDAANPGADSTAAQSTTDTPAPDAESPKKKQRQNPLAKSKKSGNPTKAGQAAKTQCTAIAQKAKAQCKNPGRAEYGGLCAMHHKKNNAQAPVGIVPPSVPMFTPGPDPSATGNQSAGMTAVADTTVPQDMPSGTTPVVDTTVPQDQTSGTNPAIDLAVNPGLTSGTTAVAGTPGNAGTSRPQRGQTLAVSDVRTVFTSPPFPQSNQLDKQNQAALDLQEFSGNTCEYLAEQLEKLRNGKGKGKFDEVLSFLEVVLAIASVTLAIKDVHAYRQGFAFLNEAATNVVAGQPPSDNESFKVMRFRRPILYPTLRDGQFIVVVLQLNQHNNIEMQFFHSRGLRHDEITRACNEAYGTAVQLITNADWLDNSIAAASLTLQAPRHEGAAIWVSAREQSEPWANDIHAILNAWAIALNLSINTEFEASNEFYAEARIIMNLARSGKLSCALLYSFLHCRNYIDPSNEWIPAQRSRFKRTVQLNTIEDLHQQVQMRASRDAAPEETASEADLAEVGLINHLTVRRAGAPKLEGRIVLFRIDTSPGSSEDSSGSSSSSSSDDDSDFGSPSGPDSQEPSSSPTVNGASSQMGPPSGPDGHEPSASGTAIVPSPGAAAAGHNPLGRPHDGAEGETEEDYTTKLERFQEKAKKRSGDEWTSEDSPCKIASKRRHHLIELIKKPGWASLRKPLSISWEAWLEDEEVTTAISCVVASIDECIMRAHREYLAGFTLVQACDIEPALTRYWQGFTRTVRNTSSDPSNTDERDPYKVVSRPRRPWLLPITLDQEVNAEAEDETGERPGRHHFLAVIQEEGISGPDDEETSFRIYSLDSLPGCKAGVEDWLFERIKRAATRLGWTAQRNPHNAVTWSEVYDELEEITVTQQMDGWACGLHTILNAWILALGLLPRSHWDADQPTVMRELIELIELACYGALDWFMLVSWLLCHNLVVERSPRAVPEDRRFKSTIRMNNAELKERILDSVQAENSLTVIYGITLPYYRGNNIDFFRRDEQ